MPSSEASKEFREYSRQVMRELRRDQRKLFRALEEFANIRNDLAAWAQFRKRWPEFFPESEYDRVMRGQKPSVYDYPYWLDQIWKGGETDPYLLILLGVHSAPGLADGGTLEDSWTAGLSSMPAHFYAVWSEGLFSYRGSCDFQRALYLLFLDSWKARICEKCGAKFIAKRAAQKFCSTDCSEAMQREFRRRWWAEHGRVWRRNREKSKSRKERRRNVTRKTR